MPQIATSTSILMLTALLCGAAGAADHGSKRGTATGETFAKGYEDVFPDYTLDGFEKVFSPVSGLPSSEYSTMNQALLWRKAYHRGPKCSS